ncbi:MAG: hypothetical protein WBW69_13530 [Candidatus Korobacteraceae bacterium]
MATVCAAVYYTSNAGYDVTTKIQGYLNQSETFTVNNTSMGGDPDPGVAKNFAMIYTNGTHYYAVQCQENTVVYAG